MTGGIIVLLKAVLQCPISTSCRCRLLWMPSAVFLALRTVCVTVSRADAKRYYSSTWFEGTQALSYHNKASTMSFLMHWNFLKLVEIYGGFISRQVYQIRDTFVMFVCIVSKQYVDWF